MTSKQLSNDTWLDILNGAIIADSNNKEEKQISDIRKLIRKQEEVCIEVPNDCELNSETERFLEEIKKEKKRKKIYSTTNNHNKNKWYSIIFSKIKNNFRHGIPAIGAITLLTLAGIVIIPIALKESSNQIFINKNSFELTPDMRYKNSNPEGKIKIIKSNDPEKESYKLAEELRKFDKNTTHLKSNGGYLIKLNKPISSGTIYILKKNNINIYNWDSLQITFINK